ncbi:phosphotransferase [Candidatus Mycoplasma mahonii]|uniref:phosphotransferase n=1 Tax=Candidatus Mycoplasma mahonii TaxID=3004105 RepID=UPI0026EA1A12|nr:phosphotransferase [Candidatus Mycoplasma mahonii]WKX02156.1 phosphotransferase [Candidatus Mycoplasma mahonii]
MKIINTGFTNKIKYMENNEMVIEKTYNGFNHQLDYKVLDTFDFVPKVLENNEKIIKSEFIKGILLTNPSDNDLVALAQEMRMVHLSSIKLPKNNLKHRVDEYLKVIHDKGIIINEIENNYKPMIKLISKMKRINPVHNDIWSGNIIKDNTGKIWIIDWEYATMGDKHFELAYYIESESLDDYQIQILLDAYDGVENKDSYNKVLIQKYRKFVLWLIICWAYAQEEMPFPLDTYIDKLKKQ